MVPASKESTILVVEDQPGLRALAQEVLTSEGYGVLVAQDGIEALRVAEAYPGQIRLLLTDLSLPETSGVEIAARLHGLRPDMKVLYMSGHPKDTMMSNGTLAPNAHFIEKPWTPRGLCQAVGKMITATQPACLRILVVDDEEGMRALLTDVLEGSGHQVLIAKDGVEAKRLVKRQAIDLVITDISMPNEEGLGVILALGKAHPDIKIIAMSGWNPDALADAKLLGAAAALTKPFTPQGLLECIRAVYAVQRS